MEARYSRPKGALMCPHTPLSRGDAQSRPEGTAGLVSVCFTNTPLWRHFSPISPSTEEGEYLVISSGEGCGDARKARRACGPCPHLDVITYRCNIRTIGTGVHTKRPSTSINLSLYPIALLFASVWGNLLSTVLENATSKDAAI
jgi:hypothetical protein